MLQCFIEDRIHFSFGGFLNLWSGYDGWIIFAVVDFGQFFILEYMVILKFGFLSTVRYDHDNKKYFDGLRNDHR